jgi:hypothetical protein
MPCMNDTYTLLHPLLAQWIAFASIMLFQQRVCICSKQIALSHLTLFNDIQNLPQYWHMTSTHVNIVNIHVGLSDVLLPPSA